MSSTTIFTAGSVILRGKGDTSLQPRAKAGFVDSGVRPVPCAADLRDNLCRLLALSGSSTPGQAFAAIRQFDLHVLYLPLSDCNSKVGSDVCWTVHHIFFLSCAGTSPAVTATPAMSSPPFLPDFNVQVTKNHSLLIILKIAKRNITVLHCEDVKIKDVLIYFLCFTVSSLITLGCNIG